MIWKMQDQHHAFYRKHVTNDMSIRNAFVKISMFIGKLPGKEESTDLV